MSCSVLDIQLANKNVEKDSGVFIDGVFQANFLRPPKKYKPTKQALWCIRILKRKVWSSRNLEYNELKIVLPKDIRADYFATGTKKCKLLGRLMDKKVKNLDDHGCHKFQELADSDE